MIISLRTSPYVENSLSKETDMFILTSKISLVIYYCIECIHSIVHINNICFQDVQVLHLLNENNSNGRAAHQKEKDK